MRKIHFVLCIALTISQSLLAQKFTFVKDIAVGAGNSSPQSFFEVNGTVMFLARTDATGVELWRTDGTEAGTVLVKDINPGAASSNMDFLTVFDNHLYFGADDGTHGVEIWKSDGTEAGTIILKDLVLGAGSTLISEITAVNSTLFMSLDDGVNGFELWKTDGTDAGTVLVSNINAASHSYPRSLVAFNGFVYFVATDGLNGRPLWRSDGTGPGTVMVRNFTGHPNGNIASAVFAGTSQLFVVVGNGVQPPSDIFVSDGSSLGTTFIIDAVFPQWLKTAGNTLYFQGYVDANYGTELMKSDGTVAGTGMVKDLRPGPASSYPFEIKEIGGSIYFIARINSTTNRLWRSDGTDAGTEIILPGNNSSAYNVNGLAFFATNDGVHGLEPWKCDGTAEGTMLIEDVDPVGSSSPGEFFGTATKVFTSMTDAINGRELWVANFLSVLTLELADLRAQLINGNGLLTWKTLSEQNTSHIEIERSLNGRNYSKVGTLPAAGNSDISRNYSFTDMNITGLNAAVVYYRLKMSDIDGKINYSKIVAINISEKEAVVMLYPNPVISNATVMIASRETEKINYNVVDNNGRVLLSGSTVVIPGSNTLSIPTQKLSPGVYVVALEGKSVRERIRIVKE